MPTVELKNPPASLPRNIEVEDEPKSGGEGAVYFSRDGQYAVKVYHRPRPDKEHLLGHVMSICRSITREQERFILPPLALIQTLDRQPRVGFVMRRVPSSYCELLDFIVTPVVAAEQYEQGKRWSDYLNVACSVANSIVVLHGRGCAHSDIHYRNFLANLDRGDAVMLEMDGVVVEGFKKAEVKGMMGFMAPEILTKGTLPNERTDRHSLAVLLLHILLLRNVMAPLVEYDRDSRRSDELGYGTYALFSEHPSYTGNRPRNLDRPLYQDGGLSYKMLPPGLQRLSQQALIGGLKEPDTRPSSRSWLDALAYALDELWMCSACTQVFPYPYWVERTKRCCPFCGACPGGPAVVLELFEEKVKYDFRSTERTVVLSPGSKLYGDIAIPSRKPSTTNRDQDVIGHTEWDIKRNEGRLVNDSTDCWIARSLNGAPCETAVQGQSLPLAPGYCIQFGEGRRLAVVRQAIGGG